MKTQLTTILKLIEKKYPTSYGNRMNPVLFIYDDESGRIMKDALESPFDDDNCLFSFSDIQELVEHLKS